MKASVKIMIQMMMKKETIKILMILQMVVLVIKCYRFLIGALIGNMILFAVGMERHTWTNVQQSVLKLLHCIKENANFKNSFVRQCAEKILIRFAKVKNHIKISVRHFVKDVLEKKFILVIIKNINLKKNSKQWNNVVVH